MNTKWLVKRKYSGFHLLENSRTDSLRGATFFSLSGAMLLWKS